MRKCSGQDYIYFLEDFLGLFFHFTWNFRRLSKWGVFLTGKLKMWKEVIFFISLNDQWCFFDQPTNVCHSQIYWWLCFWLVLFISYDHSSMPWRTCHLPYHAKAHLSSTQSESRTEPIPSAECLPYHSAPCRCYTIEPTGSPSQRLSHE